jgi:hypothetical protein
MASVDEERACNSEQFRRARKARCRMLETTDAEGHPVKKWDQSPYCTHCPRRVITEDLELCTMPGCGGLTCEMCRFSPEFKCIDCNYLGQMTRCYCQRLFRVPRGGRCTLCLQAVCEDHALHATCAHGPQTATLCNQCAHHERSGCETCTMEAFALQEQHPQACQCPGYEKLVRDCPRLPRLGKTTYHLVFEDAVRRKRTRAEQADFAESQ